MRADRILVSVLILGAGFVSGCNNGRITRLEKQNKELQVELKQQRVAELFSLQEKCAEEARKTFDDLGYKKKEMASYEDHYNEAMNKCFLLIEDTEPSGGNMLVSRNLSDALEGKVYGEYIWQSQKNKKFWEVAPLMCQVVLPSGEERSCKTEEEFKELVRPYMEISQL